MYLLKSIYGVNFTKKNIVLLLVLLFVTGITFAQQLFVAATDTQSELNADLFASIISPEMNNQEMAEIDGGQGHYHNGRYVSTSPSANGRPYNAAAIRANQQRARRIAIGVVAGAGFAVDVAMAAASPIAIVGAVVSITTMLLK